MSKTRPFEPWKRDFSAARSMLVIGAGSCIGAVGAYMFTGPSPVSLGLLGIGLILIPAALARRQRGLARQHGKQVENRLTPIAAAELTRAGMRVETNVMIRGLGDIDLVVHTTQGPVPVEIKSFRRWRQLRLPFLPATFLAGDRERKALRQSEQQRRAIRARKGLIWLPNGRISPLQSWLGTGSRTNEVVFGGTRRLLYSLAPPQKGGAARSFRSTSRR